VWFSLTSAQTKTAQAEACATRNHHTRPRNSLRQARIAKQIHQPRVRHVGKDIIGRISRSAVAQLVYALY
jgi:hypothetical protein